MQDFSNHDTLRNISHLKGIKLQDWVKAEWQTAFFPLEGITLLWRYWVEAELHPQIPSSKV